MAWKNKEPMSLKDRMMRLRNATLPKRPLDVQKDVSVLESLDKRVTKILSLAETKDKKSSTMLFFVMYDIESNKVRNQIAKYLIRSGCHRIQKSIFLACLLPSALDKIKEDLTEIQSFYENDDSILIVPISTDYLQAMKVIGREISIDVITKSKSTLFF